MLSLDGKVALVTGAAQGLGWGIARALGQAGARVCATDINAAALGQIADDFAADGSVGTTLPLDVSDLDAFDAVVRGVVALWGQLDVVVHNAVYMPLVRFAATSPELWWRQLHVSLGGLFNAAHTALPIMRRQGGGHIIGIASGSSVRGYRDEVTYCTGKHGQEGFYKALALETAADRIAVNTIGPGRSIKPTGIDWQALERMPETERAAWADPVELGRAWVWLAAQPPERFSGLRFDAGPIVDTLDREGDEFAFAPDKVTLYVDDFVARQHWYANYPD